MNETPAITAFEFDDHPGGSRRVELRTDQHGSIKVVLCGKEDMDLFGADVDQWGTWYSINGVIHVAQEWGTRSFLDALISALAKLRASAECDTAPATEINQPTAP